MVETQKTGRHKMTKAEVKNGDDRISIITKVVVGSRLHGLNTETSDWDYRGIHMHPIVDHLSPYDKIKNTTWIEGDEDNTSYELSEFCKSATHGNATILEVFFSDKIITDSYIAEEMRENWAKFMDTRKFIDASRGYAHNQYNKFYNFEDIGLKGQERTAKFAIAFLRVMWQCEQFLLTGKFECNLEKSDLYPLMKKIKPMSVEEIQPMIPEVFGKMSEMNQRVSHAMSKADKSVLDMKPDLWWIKDFIYRSYMSLEK